MPAVLSANYDLRNAAISCITSVSSADFIAITILGILERSRDLISFPFLGSLINVKSFFMSAEQFYFIKSGLYTWDMCFTKQRIEANYISASSSSNSSTISL